LLAVQQSKLVPSNLHRWAPMKIPALIILFFIYVFAGCPLLPSQTNPRPTFRAYHPGFPRFSGTAWRVNKARSF
jgi:hypothetical protein